jgi:ribonuclease HI
MEYKVLKFKTESVQPILSGKKNKTWRMYDEKQLEVDDKLLFINSDNGQTFGYGVINKITTKHVNDINVDDMTGYKKYNNSDEIVAELSRYYGPGVDTDSIVKVIDFTYLGQKSPTKVVNKATQITEVTIFTDGGSRGNPGPSACSYVLTDQKDQVIINDGAYLGVTTNNQAEYQAVIRSLKAAKKYGVKIAHVYMDSLLVVNQMNGIFKVRNRDLWPVHEAVRKQVQQFEKVTFTHIPREMNKTADCKVNEILDAQPAGGLTSNLL